MLGTQLYSPRPQSLLTPGLGIGNIMALSGTNRIPTEGDFLGHPRGLTFLFTTEIVGAFSYYGMRRAARLYMVKYCCRLAMTTSSGSRCARCARKAYSAARVQPFAIADLWSLYRVCLPHPTHWRLACDHVLGQRRAVISAPR